MPAFFCCTSGYGESAREKSGFRGVPSSARKIPREERNRRLKGLQGEWGMSLLNAPDSTKNRKLKMKYDRVFIQGDQLTSINSETGAKGETETITFKRARDGTLYVDRYGSYIRKWRPEDGYIVINNAIGFYVKYTKMPKNIRGHTRSYSYRNIIVRMESFQGRSYNSKYVGGLQTCPEGNEGLEEKSSDLVTDSSSCCNNKLVVENVRMKFTQKSAIPDDEMSRLSSGNSSITEYQA
mmetsp:Transcript_8573/g.12108  ORF Transcript_8573/g.12108 Transcript_8573/m.12108 type:complete len:238 (-) Transcript_8573:266-979(-)|eukprot:CAMPEP_0184481416 /NCGR_PEP_ID=MMETSP0113_2-20130426/2959_1 /TAXON_ID=91329 /ORGANISM="Norrisiella sphaerica, Strain BC52" /LENGTH=237 /DNA_ID=CAMNT_0026860527 /DNA_START=211 /DNA_END=924 /DNA_ORIENTATION=-